MAQAEQFDVLQQGRAVQITVGSVVVARPDQGHMGVLARRKQGDPAGVEPPDPQHMGEQGLRPLGKRARLGGDISDLTEDLGGLPRQTIGTPG